MPVAALPGSTDEQGPSLTHSPPAKGKRGGRRPMSFHSTPVLQCGASHVPKPSTVLGHHWSGLHGSETFFVLYDIDILKEHNSFFFFFFLSLLEVFS